MTENTAAYSESPNPNQPETRRQSPRTRAIAGALAAALVLPLAACKQDTTTNLDSRTNPYGPQVVEAHLDCRYTIDESGKRHKVSIVRKLLVESHSNKTRAWAVEVTTRVNGPGADTSTTPSASATQKASVPGQLDLWGAVKYDGKNSIARYAADDGRLPEGWQNTSNFVPYENDEIIHTAVASTSMVTVQVVTTPFAVGSRGINTANMLIFQCSDYTPGYDRIETIVVPDQKTPGGVQAPPEIE